jgi:hypothetical protein
MDTIPAFINDPAHNTSADALAAYMRGEQQ